MRITHVALCNGFYYRHQFFLYKMIQISFWSVFLHGDVISCFTLLEIFVRMFIVQVDKSLMLFLILYSPHDTLQAHSHQQNFNPKRKLRIFFHRQTWKQLHPTNVTPYQTLAYLLPLVRWTYQCLCCNMATQYNVSGNFLLDLVAMPPLFHRYLPLHR